ncbi:sigma-70 family RNA polymerase sigma factor [Mucilaginibacter sp. HMF5004]|uniref:RNA polymerase sigma factor n=1 Tax=Mucilaginibacter rivuli TaxID=2857527 RepID=UPI001C5DEE51|nr:sigma-70 family RNA polymerase sigma factor [Mucilaginibacter rivuli]MBW4890318.1 sigma-70 family RNA polymerase sigma factor [Mucilaginibacter rivuli]
MADKPKQSIVKTITDYSKGLFSFIRGRVRTEEDAEDILQDVWYQLSNVVDIDDIEQMSGWLYRVARNKIIDNYRKKTPEALEDMGYEDEDSEFNFNDILLADDDDPESVYLKELFWQELFVALDELPEAQRNVFVWNELEDKTLQQIANETGDNLKTIISRKGYAVKYLRLRLETFYNDFLNS